MSSLLSRAKDQLVYRVYALGWGVVKRLPERTAYRLFERLADRAWSRRGKSVTQLERNLSRVLGRGATPQQVREVSRQGMRNYFRYWCDAFRLETWSRERVVETFPLQGIERIDEAIAAGRGVILALPHMGNWDHAGAWAVSRYGQITTVAERLEPERLFARFVAYRETLGFEVLPLTGANGTFVRLLRRLRKGGLVCLVAERDLTETGVPVEFFGETTKLPAGPAALALATGAALLPATLWYEDGVQSGQIHPQLVPPAEGTRGQRIAALCQQLADVYAAGIAEHPADWHMLQKLWLTDLGGVERPETVPVDEAGE
jgi:KDO2-lipid IV(A) lauroyltransferase